MPAASAQLAEAVRTALSELTAAAQQAFAEDLLSMVLFGCGGASAANLGRQHRPCSGKSMQRNSRPSARPPIRPAATAPLRSRGQRRFAALEIQSRNISRRVALNGRIS